jgi:hypothetical protein
MEPLVVLREIDTVEGPNQASCRENLKDVTQSLQPMVLLHSERKHMSCEYDRSIDSTYS